MWNSSLAENLLSEEISKNNNVNILYCNSFMNNMCIAHDAQHKGIFSPKIEKLKICNICKNNFLKIKKNPNINYINVDKYITPDVDKEIEEYALSQKSNDQLLNFEFESLKVGKMALYELSLKNKLIKEELNTNEERAEIVDKIKQIIKFNHALKKIYSDLNPEVFVTTNGYYYITNFFLQFGKQRGAKTISISNSSSYRFSRNDLKIFHQHELLDMEIQKSLFHLYKDVYLHKKTLMHALTNVKSQIKKEHSHSFSPQYQGKINIRKKFNIEKNKKIILVVLSSQAEIFSAKNVMAYKFGENLNLFKNQIDFLKFLINESIHLENYHFIIRTHPRQYSGKISEEINEINKLNLSQYKNLSINDPKDKLSPFNFLQDIDLVINSWSTLAVDFGIFGISNITAFPDFALYPKECMNILNNKKDFVQTIKSIDKKRSFKLSLLFLKYYQVDKFFSTISFQKNFFLSKNFSNFFVNAFDKFLFKFFYFKLWNFIKKIKINPIDSKALDYFLKEKYVTFHESKYRALKESKITNDDFTTNEVLVKNEINSFTKKYLKFSNFD